MRSRVLIAITFIKNKHRDEEEASKAESMFLIAFALLSAELEACKTIDPLTSNRRNAEEKKCSSCRQIRKHESYLVNYTRNENIATI